MKLLEELLVLHKGKWKIYQIEDIALVETNDPKITWEYPITDEKTILKEIHNSMSILGYVF